MQTLLPLIILLYAFSLSVVAQKKGKYVIVKTTDKKDYFYIPQAALSDSVDGIIYQDKSLSKVDPQKKCFSLGWNSICNDGSYYLTITPKQIYFSSGHNNPNPNYLFWIINITNSQYQYLKKGFSKKADFNPIYYFDEQFVDTFPIPDYWTDSILKIKDLYCENQIKTQVIKYFSAINSYIKNQNEKINLPKNKNQNPNFFSTSRQEIIDWMPKKTKVKFTPTN